MAITVEAHHLSTIIISLSRLKKSWSFVTLEPQHSSLKVVSKWHCCNCLLWFAMAQCPAQLCSLVKGLDAIQVACPPWATPLDSAISLSSVRGGWLPGVLRSIDCSFCANKPAGVNTVSLAHGACESLLVDGWWFQVWDCSKETSLFLLCFYSMKRL